MVNCISSQIVPTATPSYNKLSRRVIHSCLHPPNHKTISYAISCADYERRERVFDYEQREWVFDVCTEAIEQSCESKSEG